MEILKRHQQDKLAKSLLAGPWRLATAFSGMGTAEVAARHLVSAAQKHGFLQADLNLAWACDNARTCQKLLLKHKCCLFPDICKTVRYFSMKGITNTKQLTARLLKLLAVHGKELASKRTHCLLHQRRCSLDPGAGEIFIGGTSCVAWSTIGSRLGAADPSTKSLVAFVLQAATRPLFVHENVKGFPDLLEATIGHSHRIYAIEVHPKDVGFGVIARPRRYRIGIRKDVKQAGLVSVVSV